MATSHSVGSLLFDQPPDCIENVPSKPEAFIIGTYHLKQGSPRISDEDERSRVRSGTLVLCRVDGDHIIEEAVASTHGGAYDVHFVQPITHQTEDVVGVSTSEGLISLYVVGDKITAKQHYQIAKPDVLITSFAWHPTQLNIIAASLSTGEVVVCALDAPESSQASDIYEATTQVEVAKHSEAAWHVIWSATGQTLLHGGDDAMLGWCHMPLGTLDLIDRLRLDPPRCGMDKRIHGAGVTAILPLNDEWLLTGSYDDHLRVVRLDGRARSTAELQFGDGVFRLRFLRTPQNPSSGQPYSALILTSCMRSGTRILEVQGKSEDSNTWTWTLRILATFTENKSLNYASASSSDSIISLSFYERKAFLWHTRDLPKS